MLPEQFHGRFQNRRGRAAGKFHLFLPREGEQRIIPQKNLYAPAFHTAVPQPCRHRFRQHREYQPDILFRLQVPGTGSAVADAFDLLAFADFPYRGRIHSVGKKPQDFPPLP